MACPPVFRETRLDVCLLAALAVLVTSGVVVGLLLWKPDSADDYREARCFITDVQVNEAFCSAIDSDEDADTAPKNCRVAIVSFRFNVVNGTVEGAIRRDEWLSQAEIDAYLLDYRVNTTVDCFYSPANTTDVVWEVDEWEGYGSLVTGTVVIWVVTLVVLAMFSVVTLYLCYRRGRVALEDTESWSDKDDLHLSHAQLMESRGHTVRGNVGRRPGSGSSEESKWWNKRRVRRKKGILGGRQSLTLDEDFGDEVGGDGSSGGSSTSTTGLASYDETSVSFNDESGEFATTAFGMYSVDDVTDESGLTSAASFATTSFTAASSSAATTTGDYGDGYSVTSAAGSGSGSGYGGS